NFLARVVEYFSSVPSETGQKPTLIWQETRSFMARTGRKPFETTDVVPFGAGNERLRPPPSLAEPEKQAFLDLVTTTDPKQFRPSDLPRLCRWAELTVMAEQAAGELQAGGMVTADGRVSPWFTI